jgi:pyrroline-5-carboxylate reductase
MSLNKRIGFMGAGQMAEALARGLIDKGVVHASQVCCSDPAAARKELFRSLGATPYDTNLEVTAAVAARHHCCCWSHTARTTSSA